MKASEDLIKNDVPATGQLKECDCVSYRIRADADLKIAFLGNSITRHGKAENLGWYGDWGMAASRPENDYVHKLIDKFESAGTKVSYCIANMSEWERTRDMSLLTTRYAEVKSFNADIVIVRLGENAGLTQNLEKFKGCYKQMVRFFSGSAKVVLCDLFWEYEPFDSFVKKFAEENGYAFVKIHDLGNMEEMKAVGKFRHAGVAAHPNDSGMAEIAERIYVQAYDFNSIQNRLEI